MKKLISLLLCALMLSVYFTVFSVPAMAKNYFNVYSLEELYTALDQLKKESHDEYYIYAYGNNQIWEVNKLIFIDLPSCNIDFYGVNFAIGHDGDYNYYNDSLIEVNQNNVTLDFYKCTFDTDQHDLLNGGDLVSDANGAAIYIDGHNCTIDGHNSTVFHDCKTNGYYGGAICDDGYNNTIIKNCEFKDCECTGLGGAIYTEGTNCTVENCKFSGCTAPEGGSNIYSWYEDQVFARGCIDQDGNDLDGNTCYNCTLEPFITYVRRTDFSRLLYPTWPEDGYYILRSAVDPNYVVEILEKSSRIILGQVGGSQTKLLQLKKNSDGKGYKIYTVHNYVLKSGSPYEKEQIYEVINDINKRWKGLDWYFESDAPGGDDRYYIHTIDEGGWMEAALADGEMPWNGTTVQSNLYTGSTKQVWILEKVDAPSGFTISEGNTWIIVAGAVVILGGVAAIVVSNKKKKAALSKDAESENK